MIWKTIGTDPFLMFFTGIPLIFLILFLIDRLMALLHKRRPAPSTLHHSMSAHPDTRSNKTIAKKPEDHDAILLREQMETSIKVHQDLLYRQYREKDALSTRLEEITENKNDIAKRLESALAEGSRFESEADALRKEMENLKKEYSASDAMRHEEMEAMQASHNQKQETLESQITELTNERDTLSTDLKNQKAARADLEEETAELKTRLKDLDQQLNTSTEELGKRIEKLEAEHADLEKTKTDLSTERTQLLSQVDLLTSKKEDNEKLISTLDQKIEDLVGQHKQIVDALESQIETLQDGNAGLKSDLSERIRNLQQENAELEEKLAQAVPREEWDILENKKNYLTSELNNAKLMYAQLQSQLGLYRNQDTVDNAFLTIGDDPVSKTLYEENQKQMELIKELEAKVLLLENNARRYDILSDKNIKLQKELLALKGELPADTEPAPANKAPKKKAAKKKTASTKGGPKAKKAKKKTAGKKSKTRELAKAPSEELILSDADLLDEMDAPAIPKLHEPEPQMTLYNVFLPKLTTPEKKAAAIPLIVEIAGISEEEAAEMVKKTVIPLLKGVDKPTAEEIKERFKDTGILPRVREEVRG